MTDNYLPASTPPQRGEPLAARIGGGAGHG